MGDMRLRLRDRLRDRRAYQWVFANPFRSKDCCLTVLSRPNALSHPRLGVALARRHVRSAVTRNRLKRVIREYFRLHRHQLPKVDLVVLAQRGLGERSNSEIRASLARHWKRLNKRCEPC